jgi:hypothetical protein
MGIFKRLAKIKADIFFIFLLFLISVWGLKSLFGGPYYTSQDGIHQAARLYYFKMALKDGVFPPRWSNLAYYSYGYPLFQFNYHLPWYAAIPLFALKFDIFDSIKIIHFAAFFFSGVFMYIFLKELVSRKFLAFAGAFLFLISPYRFVNIYVRNSVGEVFAIMFFPLVFYSLLKLVRTKKWIHALLLAVWLYGIILSHAMTFVIFAPSIFIFGLYCLSISKDRKKFIIQTTVAFVLFLGLAAYYLFPAFIERKYTIFDMKFGIIYARELLDFSRILYSRWGYSGNGNLPEEIMSLQFGIANWIAVLLPTIFLVFRFIKTKSVKGMGLMIIGLLTIVLSIFLMTKQALLVWNLTSRIFAIDFPWKLLMVCIFWSAIVMSIFFKNFHIPFKRIVILALLALMIYANRNHIRVNKYISFDVPQAAFYERGTNTEDEYIPKWELKSIYLRINATAAFINPKSRVEVAGGHVKNIVDKNQKFSYEYDGKKALHIVRKFYFPGWYVYVSGKRTEFTYEHNGFYNFVVPFGKSKIEIVYEGTTLVNACNYISLVSWAVLFVSLPIIFLKKK